MNLANKGKSGKTVMQRSRGSASSCLCARSSCVSG